MALKLELNDEYGNTYPDGYSMFSELHIVKKQGSILLVFDNYPDQERRNTRPDKFISQTIFRAGPEPGPAELTYDGTTTVDAAAIAVYGVTVADGKAVSDGTMFDADAPAVLAASGITIVSPPVPSYAMFAGPDFGNPTGVNALIYGFAKSRPEFAGAVDVL